jgi:fibronectin-binding autotransporter adhesin
MEGRFFKDNLSVLGDVGIGTNDPSYKFELTSDAGSGLISRIYNTNLDGQGLLIRAGCTANATRVLQLASENDTKIMTVNSNGNVGIGTANPSEKLHVNGLTQLGAAGKTEGGAIITYASFSEIKNAAATLIGNAVVPGTANNTIQHSKTDAGNYIKLKYNQGITFHTNITNSIDTDISEDTNESVRIDLNGNVGIGTAVPDDKLDVVGQFRISANKSATTNKTNRIRGEHYDITEEPVTFMFMNSFSTTNTLYIGGGSSVENAATQLNFFTAANNTTTTGTLRMLIQSDGNVGIGTASPSQKLHVQGNLRVTGAYYDSNNEAGTSNQVLTSTGLGGTDWKSLSQIGDTVTGCGTTNKITKWSDGPNSDLTDSSFLSESGTTLTNTATVTEFTTTNTQLRLPNYGRVAIGAASTNSVLLANVGDNATFSNGEAVIKGENSGNRGTVGHASGSDLLRLNFSDALGMILNKDGHVGIGNAVSQVYTNENTSTVNLRVGSDTVSTNQSSTIQIGGHDSSGCGTLGAIEFFNRRDYSIVAKIQVRRDLESSTKLSAGQIDFYTDDGDNNLNARMSIDALGNVGIGTTIPTQKLYVAGNAVVNGDIHLETAGDCITFYGNCNGNHSITSRDANGAVADDLRINTYGSLFINLDSNVNNTDCADFMIGRHGTSTISDWLFTLNGETGNVGIGTTSPDACLHLQGNAHLQVGSTTGGQSAVMGSTSTTDAGALNYRAYWSYDSYWDHDTCLWNAKRATLGRKWKAEMSYHDDHFQISRQGNVCTTWANSDWSNFFTINNVGNVGIGTTSPALQSGGTGLHINDTTNSELKFTNNTTGATASDGTALVASGSTFTLNNREAGSIKLGTSNTTRVTIDSAGNVGIGTTSPGGKLDVNGMIKAGIAGNSSANTPALLVSSAGVNPEQSAIAIQQGTTEGDTIIFADYEPYVEWGLSTDNGLNTIEFTGGTNTNNLGSKTLYNQSGNARTAYKKAIVELTSGNMSVGGSVGIGTANPASVSQTPRLAVVHNGAGIATFDATGAGGGYITITDSNTPLAYLGSSYQLISSNGAITDTALRSQGELVFATGGSSERMRIDSSGNVGIGTTNPTSTLHITKAGATDATICVDATSTGDAYITLDRQTSLGCSYIQFQDGAVDVWGVGTYGADRLDFVENSTTSRMSIIPGGNVGIGTASPTQKLHVQGNLSLTGAFYDSNNQTGSSGEILSSTGSGTDWVSLCQISGVTANGSQSTCYIPKWTDGTNEVIGNSVIYENASGNIGINCTTPSYKLHVNGSFAATCKSFVIDHPTKCGHMLRYGSLESPYHGVRLTGKSCTIGGEAKVSLPNYMCGLVHKEDINVQITNYRHGCTMWVDDVDISNNNFRVKTETEETKEFYWTFTAERKDVDRMQTEYKSV